MTTLAQVVKLLNDLLFAYRFDENELTLRLIYDNIDSFRRPGSLNEWLIAWARGVGGPTASANRVSRLGSPLVQAIEHTIATSTPVDVHVVSNSLRELNGYVRGLVRRQGTSEGTLLRVYEESGHVGLADYIQRLFLALDDERTRTDPLIQDIYNWLSTYFSGPVIAGTYSSERALEGTDEYGNPVYYEDYGSTPIARMEPNLQERPPIPGSHNYSTLYRFYPDDSPAPPMVSAVPIPPGPADVTVRPSYPDNGPFYELYDYPGSTERTPPPLVPSQPVPSIPFPSFPFSSYFGNGR